MNPLDGRGGRRLEAPGLWRARVVAPRRGDRRVFVEIPRFAPGFKFGPIGVGDGDYDVGEWVLVGFVEGRTDAPEVIRSVSAVSSVALEAAGDWTLGVPAPRAHREGRWVQLAGVLNGGSAGSVATVPVNYRPAFTRQFAVAAGVTLAHSGGDHSHGAHPLGVAAVTVTNGGVVSINVAATYVDLSSVRYERP